MNSPAILLCPTWMRIIPFSQCIDTVDTPYLVVTNPCRYQVNCHGVAVLVFKQLLSYLIMVPKCKNSNVGKEKL